MATEASEDCPVPHAVIVLLRTAAAAGVGLSNPELLDRAVGRTGPVVVFTAVPCSTYLMSSFSAGCHWL